MMQGQTKIKSTYKIVCMWSVLWKNHRN